MADDGSGGAAAGGIVLLAEGAADGGRDAENPEEVSVDEEAFGGAGFAAGGEVEGLGAPDGESGEGLLVGADAVELYGGENGAPGGPPPSSAGTFREVEVGEFFRLLNGEGAEPDGVNQLKNRGVGTDSEGQG